MFSKRQGIGMEYNKLIETVASEKWAVLSDKLVDLILASKNYDKMPGQLANSILSYWQRDVLSTRPGLAAVLEAAVVLEPEKTIAALNELQLTDVAEQLKRRL